MDWQEERRRETRPSGAAGLLRLAIDTAGRAALVPAAVLPLPADSGQSRRCVGSERFAAGRGGERYAAWWGARPDSSAVVLVARSTDDGATWGVPLAVDTLDRGVRACARPAPGLAADTLNNFIHVVYFLDAPEGPGLFYAHQMDPRAAFEPATVIVYGRRSVGAAIATSGDTVAVAYEDPNGARPRVALALSRTAGHIFEDRHVEVSGDAAQARDPRVALGSGRIAVGWTEGEGVAVVRVGKIK